MAIAFDAATVGGYSATMNGKTFAHTCTGSNLILFVGTAGASNSDTVTGVTYAGAAMTKIASRQNTASADARFSTLWYLLNPATGANNVVIAASAGDGIADAASYTGANQSGQPDNSTTGANGTTGTAFDTTLTTNTDNCWTILAARNDLGSSGAGTNTTQRTNDTSGYSICDSNGPITPAGSNTLQVTTLSATFFATVMASFKPVQAAPQAVKRLRMLVGIGQ